MLQHGLYPASFYGSVLSVYNVDGFLLIEQRALNCGTARLRRCACVFVCLPVWLPQVAVATPIFGIHR